MRKLLNKLREEKCEDADLALNCCSNTTDSLSSVEQNSERPEDTDSIESGDENKERGNWGGKFDFLLSCIGYAVGLGNLWRFPYLCFKNGGGAFVLPYLISLFLCGTPLFFMELCWGQFTSRGPIPAWNIMPILKGVGYCAVMISFTVIIYYNVLMSWVLFYLFSSFTSVLPWSHCENWWNTDQCSHNNDDTHSTDNSTLAEWWERVVMKGNSTLNATALVVANTTSELVNTTSTLLASSDLETPLDKALRTPSNEYFMERMLDVTDGLHDLGGIRLELAGCLVLGWIIVYLCIIKGVKSTGKVVYFTATFPYIVLTILLIRGVTLDGAIDGIKFYMIPDFSKILNFEVWAMAAIQIFYSLGPGWGGLLTFASYNRFNHNCQRDAIIVSVTNSATSIYAGLVIFSVIGFLSHHLGVDISEVAAQGPSLAFEAYPEAIARLPISPFWAILFFTMLITLGLDSQFGMLEGIISALVDEFPNTLRKRKWLFTIVICFIAFLVGLPIVTRGGVYLFTLLDMYVAAPGLLIGCFLEVVVISWVYGADRFYEDIEMMLGEKPYRVWSILWKYVTPVMIATIFVFSLISYSGLEYNHYTYPLWAEIVGWGLAATCVMFIPLVAMIEYWKCPEDTCMKKLKALCRPSKLWGPALDKHRDGDRYPKLEPESRINLLSSEKSTPAASRGASVIFVDENPTEMTDTTI